MKLTKNVDLDKHKYSDYDTEFDSLSEFSLHDGIMGEKSHSFWS